MSTLFPDTHPVAEALLIDQLRAASPWRKPEMADQLNQAIEFLATTGLKKRYPDEDEGRLDRRLAGLLVGEELACQAYGPLTGES